MKPVGDGIHNAVAPCETRTNANLTLWMNMRGSSLPEMPFSVVGRADGYGNCTISDRTRATKLTRGSKALQHTLSYAFMTPFNRKERTSNVSFTMMMVQVKSAGLGKCQCLNKKRSYC